MDENGSVDYVGLKENPADLAAYENQLQALSPQTFASWSEPDQIALWINAYNAFTLRLIIDHYPIRRRLTRAMFPVGIRHIPGNWDEVRFPVMGRSMTLNEIEHETLRKDHVYPAIHMSLVCAAMGCPPLRREAYIGARLDEQHDDQTRRLLAHPDKFQIDHGAQVVRLSAIFDWFGEDFIRTHAEEASLSWGSPKERGVLGFLWPHLSDADRAALRDQPYRVEFFSYDWSLNEQS